MADYNIPHSRAESMMESASAGLYSYQSPYTYANNYARMNPDEEMDLGQAEDAQSRGPSARPSFEVDDSRQPTLPHLRDSPRNQSGFTRESRFTEVFRTLSTTLKRSGASLSQRRRNTAVAGSNLENEAPQSRLAMDELAKKYGHVPRDCHSRDDVHIRRFHWLYIWQALMALLATGGSAVAFAVAVRRMEWGPQVTKDNISSWNYAYKVIEILFAGVYVTFLGQVLTRRAFSQSSKAFNIAEVTMRNWVIQPGSLVTHADGLPHAGMSILGIITILATVCTLSYTTACNELITPRILWSDWKQHGIFYGNVRSSYANMNNIKSACPVVDTASTDPEYLNSCLIMKANGESYRTLIAYLSDWENTTYSTISQTIRPGASAIIMENTTLSSSWLDRYPSALEVDGRLINNVTLVMPHAGLSTFYSNSFNSSTNIRKPGELDDSQGYDIGAAVVSPSINVMCVTADVSEVRPLLVSKLPTPLEDVFYWGKKYNSRYRPTFEALPPARQFVTDARRVITNADSIYIMAKADEDNDEYTLCQMRSVVVSTCSTRFQVSRFSGNMSAECDGDIPIEPYGRLFGSVSDEFLAPSWRDLAVQWNIALGLNNGVTNSSSANQRLLSGFILSKPELQEGLPSLAEALAVWASPTLIDSSLGATFYAGWPHGDENDTLPEPGITEEIVAMYRFRTYISGSATKSVTPGQVALLTVLAVVPILSANLFTLAINSPPSRVLQGACGRGPVYKDLGVSFRVGYSESANHYYFEDAQDAPLRTAAKKISRLSGLPTSSSQANLLADGAYSESYKRLSAKHPLL
ncbi:hypothetical protein SCAR479_00502 [Seiridium cardinale]|uniref:Uncharacterized protein n=1 Tax=Seiridium cardinale TaxID=138064 RepID=A0ABR2Y9P9_9PEZI